MDRTSPSRHPERASTDRAELDSLLGACRVGHIGFVVEGRPVVLPTAIARQGDRVLIHGSTGSPWMRRLATGADAALAVTALEGLVVARSAFESSMHYRSAVIFGSCERVEGSAKAEALDVLTDSLLPGRVAEVRRPTQKELAATLVLALPIQEWSLKQSAGWPDDPDSDVAGPAWAGVVPMRTTYEEPLSAPNLRPEVVLPESVRRLG